MGEYLGNLKAGQRLKNNSLCKIISACGEEFIVNIDSDMDAKKHRTVFVSNMENSEYIEKNDYVRYKYVAVIDL